MIPNTIYLEWVAYYFYADTYQWWDFISYKYISRDINNGKIPFMSVGSTYKDAESKMIEVLKNAWII